MRRWEYRAGAFAVLPASTRQRISHADVENRMITVCDNINPENCNRLPQLEIEIPQWRDTAVEMTD